MYNQKYLHLFVALFAFAWLVAVDARSAELAGALQYPPSSVGQDAQPPPPAGMVPQPVSPRRIEMGVSGTDVPPRPNDPTSARRFDWGRRQNRLRPEPEEISRVHRLNRALPSRSQAGRRELCRRLGDAVDQAAW
jgi:hypothetical protein